MAYIKKYKCNANKRKSIQKNLLKQEMYSKPAQEESQDYCVEKILGKRTIGDDKIEYLLKWDNWSDEFNNWEPSEHLNCTELIDEFENAKSKIDTLEEDDRFRGFNRGLFVEKIIGATEHIGSLMFLVKWRHCWDVDLLPAQEVNEKAPKAVIKYYQNRKMCLGGKHC